MDLCIGIDVAEQRKGLDAVALDADRCVVAAIAHATLAQVVEMVGSLQPDVVCIDSPPAWTLGGTTRAGERGLRALGITSFSTPTDPGDHPFYRWMRVGFSIFDAFADDYPRYRGGTVRGTAVEVFPEATAVLLRGHLRPKNESKSVFRRAVLADCGVDHASLRSVDAVDAALAALTGILALEGQMSSVGDAEEGMIVLPVSPLPNAPLTRPWVDAGPRPTLR